MTTNKEAIRQLSMDPDVESHALHGHQNEIKQSHEDNTLLAQNTTSEKIPRYLKSGTALETCSSAKTTAGHQSGNAEIKTDKIASSSSGTSSESTEKPRVRLLSDQEVENYRYLDDFFFMFTDKTQTQLNDTVLSAAFDNKKIVGVGFGLNDKKFPCFTLMVHDDVFADKGSHEAILDDVTGRIKAAQPFTVDSKRCKEFLKIQPMVVLPNAKTLKHGGSRLLNNKRQPIGTITCLVKAEVEITNAKGKKHYPTHFAITCAHCILPINPNDPLFKQICAEEKKLDPGDESIQPRLPDQDTLMDTPPHDAKLVASPPAFTLVERYDAKKPFAPDCLRYANHPWKQHELMRKSKYFITSTLPDSSEQELKYCCSRFGICTEHPDLPCMDLLQEDYLDEPDEVFYTVDIGVLRFVNRFTFCCCGIRMRSLPSQTVTNKALLICNPLLPQGKPNKLQLDKTLITAANISKEYISLRLKTYSLENISFTEDISARIVEIKKQHAAKMVISGKNYEDVFFEVLFQHQPKTARDFFANFVEEFEKDVISAQSDAKDVLRILDKYADQGSDGKRQDDKIEIHRIVSGNIILQSYLIKEEENLIVNLKYKLMKKILLIKEKSKHPILMENISQLENQITNIKEKEKKINTTPEQKASVTNQPQKMSVQHKVPLQQAQCNTPKRLPEEVHYFPPKNSTAEPLSTKKQKPIKVEKLIDIWTQMCSDEEATLKIAFLKTGTNKGHINNDQDQAMEPVLEQNDLRGLQFYFQIAVKTKQQKFLKLPVIMFPSKHNEQGEDEDFVKDGDSGSPLFLISENDADTQCYFLGNVCGSTAATRWDIGITSVAPKILKSVLLDIDDENANIANNAWLRLEEKFFRKDSICTHESKKTVWAEEKIEYETEIGTVTTADVKFTITPCLEACHAVTDI